MIAISNYTRKYIFMYLNSVFIAYINKIVFVSAGNESLAILVTRRYNLEVHSSLVALKYSIEAI